MSFLCGTQDWGYPGIKVTGTCEWGQIFIPKTESPISLTQGPKRVQQPRTWLKNTHFYPQKKWLIEFLNETCATVWHKIEKLEVRSFFINPKNSCKIFLPKTSQPENSSPKKVPKRASLLPITKYLRTPTPSPSYGVQDNFFFNGTRYWNSPKIKLIWHFSTTKSGNYTTDLHAI